MYRKALKILHELGAVGVLGTLAACIVLVATAPRQSLAEYAAVRQCVAALTQWLLVPSLAVVLVSGLLAIAASETYINAAWPWIKAVTGISMFEGSLLTISGSARQAAELSALAAAGHPDAALLDQALRTEWGGLWIIVAVSIANIVIAVWRPRIGRRAPGA
jgi:hypothetical protein